MTCEVLGDAVQCFAAQRLQTKPGPNYLVEQHQLSGSAYWSCHLVSPEPAGIREKIFCKLLKDFFLNGTGLAQTNTLHFA